MTVEWGPWVGMGATVALAATIAPYTILEVVGYGCAASTWAVAGVLWQIDDGGPGLIRTRPWMAAVALGLGSACLLGAWLFTYWPSEALLVALALPCYTLMGVVWTRLTR